MYEVHLFIVYTVYVKYNYVLSSWLVLQNIDFTM